MSILKEWLRTAPTDELVKLFGVTGAYARMIRHQGVVPARRARRLVEHVRAAGREPGVDDLLAVLRGEDEAPR